MTFAQFKKAVRARVSVSKFSEDYRCYSATTEQGTIYYSRMTTHWSLVRQAPSLEELLP